MPLKTYKSSEKNLFLPLNLIINNMGCSAAKPKK